MIPEAYELAKMATTQQNQYGIPLNFGVDVKGTGNIAQYPPVYPEFLYEDVFANPIATTVLSNILGPKPELRFLHSNSVVSHHLPCLCVWVG
jgi:hypothetical protein